MNMEKYTKNNFLSVDDVKEAAIKTITVLSKGEEYDGTFGKQVKFEVQLSGQEDIKLFTPNKQSIVNMVLKEGSESTKWLGKTFPVEVELNKNNKEMVIVSIDNHNG